jgi:hypothetical protein
MPQPALAPSRVPSNLASSLAVIGVSMALSVVAGYLAARHAAPAPKEQAITSEAPAPPSTTVYQIVTQAAANDAPASEPMIRPDRAPSSVPSAAPTPLQVRAMMRDRITTTPPSTERWTRDASGVFDGWSASLSDRGAVRLGRVECFEAGCIARATYRDSGTYEAMSASFVASQGFSAWPAGKWRSPETVTASGEVEADWVLFPPTAE